MICLAPARLLAAGEITLSDEPSKALRRLREAHGLTQTEVARRLHIYASIVSDYESGRRKSPRIATIKRLVEAIVPEDAE